MDFFLRKDVVKMSDVVRFFEMDWKNGLLFAAAVIIVAVFLI